MSATSPPVRLQRLEIRDFRGIDHLELDFPEGDEGEGGVLVLAGDNGCGKTSVLEAILLVLGRIDLLPADTAKPGELVRQEAGDFAIEGALESGARKTVLHIDSSGLELLLFAPHDPDFSGPLYGPTITRALLDPLFVGLPHGVPKLSQCAVEYFSARREPIELGAMTTSGSSEHARQEDRRLSELKRRIANVFGRKGYEQLFGRIATFLESFLGKRWELDVLFADDVPGSERVVVLRDGPLPELPSSGEWTFANTRALASPRVIPIDRLSSGEMALLAMTYPFVFAERVPDLVLIDEPEQHLHATWQRAFLGAMRKLSPTTQFIATTHSPYVLDSVASYERRQLVRSDEPTPVPTRDAAE